jgi:hypothetical protein
LSDEFKHLWNPQVVLIKEPIPSGLNHNLPLQTSPGTGEAAMGAAAVAASASANLEVLRAGLEREAQQRVQLGAETAEQLKQMLGPLQSDGWDGRDGWMAVFLFFDFPTADFDTII